MVEVTQHEKVTATNDCQALSGARAARVGGSGVGIIILGARGRNWALGYYSTQRLFDLQLNGDRDMLDQTPQSGTV